MKKLFFSLAGSVLAGIFIFSGCEKTETGDRAGASIAVFIPGVLAGSPTYEMLADGVQRAAENFAAANPERAPGVSVIEGGFNQAEWENQITTLAASGIWDLIVSSNPSLPDIVSQVSSKFPNQKFLIFDGELAGNPSVHTIRYNQREQAFLAGHIAALAALESLENEAAGDSRTGAKIVGLVAGQEYPMMNNAILPGFLEGARAADPDFNVDFRVVGNWFDAARAAEISSGMIRSGVRALLPIAGGANFGVLQAAEEAGIYVVWYNENGYALGPGTVAGSIILRQDRAAYEKTMLYLEGGLPFGTALSAGIAEGFVDFEDEDPIYISRISGKIRESQAALTARLRSGELLLPD